MSGMNGISSSGSMPKNCGMEGMHGNSSKKEAVKVHQHSEEAHQNAHAQSAKIPDGIRGKLIDYQV